MKFILFCVFILFSLISFGWGDRCDYSYCVKDELHVCEDLNDRIACNNKSGLHVTYRTAAYNPITSHKCCVNWKMADIADKHLWCVRNLRDARRKCTSEKLKNYDQKFQTRCPEHVFSCE